MKKVKIKLVILGGIKYDINIPGLREWSSDFFQIDNNIEIINALPNSLTEENEKYIYTDAQLKSIIGERSNVDLTVAIINQELEKNYYERSIGNNCYVLSLYETGKIVLENNFKVFHFVIQELYYFAAVYYRSKGKIPVSDDGLTHHDIRRCLFDFNDDKNDIAYSLGRASVCNSCAAEFDRTFVPEGFVHNIEKELKRIKKGMFFRIRDFIRNKPIISLVIAIVLAFLINIASNAVYDWIKSSISTKSANVLGYLSHY